MMMMMTRTALRGVTVPSLRNIGHLGDDNAAEIEMAEESDLLDLVPQDRVVDLRSPRQAELMENLINDLAALDGEVASEARRYTDGMTERGLWTPGYEGTASAWITRMIAKLDQLRAAAARKVNGAQTYEIPDGRYAVEEDGALKFFHVRNGREGTRWAGFVFVDIQASDDLHPLKDRARKARVLALIAADLETASRRYGQELGVCGVCGRTLTDEDSRAYGIGPVCRNK